MIATIMVANACYKIYFTVKLWINKLNIALYNLMAANVCYNIYFVVNDESMTLNNSLQQLNPIKFSLYISI